MKARELSEAMARYEERRRCPRSVKRLRAWCERLKEHLAERAAKAEEKAAAWRGDGQRWAGLTVVSRIFRLQIRSVDQILERLNELILEAETTGREPIDAVVQLGRELGLESWHHEHWEAKAKTPYEPGAFKQMKRRRLRQTKRKTR